MDCALATLRCAALPVCFFLFLFCFFIDACTYCDIYVYSFFYIAVNCGTLTNPTNGRVIHTGGTTFGQTATYSCNTGYDLVGDSVRTCQATRVWSGSAPACQGI